MEQRTGDVWTESGRLAKVLGGWSALSIVTGVGCALVGWRRSNPVLSGLGRQSVAWGAVDGAIAAFGARHAGEDRTGAAADPVARARRLQKVLAVNAALDVGYLALGTRLARRRPKRSDGTGLRTRDTRGDGLAVLGQGAFLLALDTAYARRMGALARVDDED